MSTRQLFLILLSLSLLLSACGDDNDMDIVGVNAEQPIEQRGFGEVELYDPVNNLDGAYLPTGSTAVLFLEAPETDATVGDTGSVGEDSVWLDLQYGGYLGLEMEDADLEVIDRAQLIDSTGEILIEVNAGQRSGEVTIPAGKYALAFRASHEDESPLPLFVSFTESTDQTTDTAATERFDPSHVINLSLGQNCGDCNLSGADLSGMDLSKRDLSGAMLIGARLVGVNLSQTHLERAELWNANLEPVPKPQNFSVLMTKNTTITQARQALPRTGPFKSK